MHSSLSQNTSNKQLILKMIDDNFEQLAYIQSKLLLLSLKKCLFFLLFSIPLKWKEFSEG